VVERHLRQCAQRGLGMSKAVGHAGTPEKAKL
jgi:hypothetical protein